MLYYNKTEPWKTNFKLSESELESRLLLHATLPNCRLKLDENRKQKQRFVSLASSKANWAMCVEEARQV